MKEITYTVKVAANGDKFWYVNGKLSREDGPACEYANGDKWWYVDGKLHRIDGPACEYASGCKLWYVNGKRHREDGPAMECANGSKFWYVNGQRHHEDGPAVELANGCKLWYVNGVQFTEEQFNERKKSKKSSCANKIICEESGGETRWIHKRKGTMKTRVEIYDGEQWLEIASCRRFGDACRIVDSLRRLDRREYRAMCRHRHGSTEDYSPGVWNQPVV